MTALSAPLAVAALVLCVAGIAKLRSPRTATLALRAAGIPAGGPLIPAFGGCELAVGLLALLVRGRVPAVAIACLYALFAVLALVLARRHASCGCFGEHDAPASVTQALLSAASAGVGLAASVAPPPTAAAWVAGHGPGLAVPLTIGVLGAVYGTVVAYTELAGAWQAWSGR